MVRGRGLGFGAAAVALAAASCQVIAGGIGPRTYDEPTDGGNDAATDGGPPDSGPADTAHADTAEAAVVCGASAPPAPSSPQPPGNIAIIAAVREAVNRLLPTVSIGGELVGIRLAKLRFPDSVVVTATIVVEVLLTVVAQYIFAAGGVVLMLAAHPELSFG